jgi:sugar phosphate isomerase/epimerase
LKIGATVNWSNDIIKEIRFLSDLGFDFVELHTGNPQIRNKKEEIFRSARKLSLKLTGHLPHLGFCPSNLSGKIENLQKISEDINIFFDLGIEKIVIHGYVGREVTVSNLKRFDMEQISILKLKEFAEKCKNLNMKLCLENTREKPENFEKFFERIPSLYFCLDIGHANLFKAGNFSFKFLEKFGDRLNHVHMKDNFGRYSDKIDMHLPVGVGKIDFKSIIQNFKDIGYNDTITLEIVSNYREEYLKISKKILNKLLINILGQKK